MMKKKLFWFIFLLFIPIVNATSIGVSPGNAIFDNMLKGGYAEAIVTVSTNSIDPVVTSLEVDGEILDWLTLEPDNETFTMSSAEPYLLKLIIQPPPDARSDYYTGSIEFITEMFGDVTGRAGGFVRAGVKLIIETIVSDEEIIACRAGGFDFEDMEVTDPLKLSLTVINDGNVRLRPTISYDIWDQNQENLVLTGNFRADEILPTTRAEIRRSISNELAIGQYWATINVGDCGSSGLMTFSVVERGGIIDKGTLERIVNPLWIYSFDPVEIAAVFKNEGPRTVSAKFKGDVRLDNNIVEIIETEEIDVPSQQTANIIFYFTPEQPGRYIISGRVTYNKKLTFAKSSVMNVNYPKAKRKVNMVPLIIYVVLIITIMFLVRWIILGKRRRKKKHEYH